jgi:peptidoglycan hydrolase-like protein with peptidoglycan-binding domain
MQPRKFRILSAITAGSLALAVVAITASSGTSQMPKHTALADQTGSSPPVNLDDCPILHTGYPQGGCVIQLQTDLRIVQDPNLDVDGIFGSVGSQTYDAVIAFQGAHGLKQDGMVGPATKNALETVIQGSTVPPTTVPPTTVPPTTVPPRPEPSLARTTPGAIPPGPCITTATRPGT